MKPSEYEDRLNDTSYELGGVHAIMGALYEKYLERSYDRPLVGEELREFTSAYGFCLDMLNKKRHEFDNLWKQCVEVAK